MSETADTLRIALAETFAFYFKAHSFHWNVEGPNFPAYHTLFGQIYDDAHDAVDTLAEQIRTLDEFAPASVAEMMEGSKIVFSAVVEADGMVAQLTDDNDIVLSALNTAMAAAIKGGKAGVANVLQDRITAHAKWGWMLRATGA